MKYVISLYQYQIKNVCNVHLIEADTYIKEDDIFYMINLTTQ